MTQFQLDTSGAVEQPGLYRSLRWSDLSPFTQGYIEALLSEPETARAWWLRHSGPFGIPAAAPFRDLAPETLARIIADCAVLQNFGPFGSLENHVEGGREAWENRQAGNLIALDFPPLTVQLGDDGKVRVA